MCCANAKLMYAFPYLSAQHAHYEWQTDHGSVWCANIEF